MSEHREPARPHRGDHQHDTATVNRTLVIECRIVRELDVAEARRHAKQMAESLRFKTVRVYRLITAVSELACNLCFHASDGGVVRLSTIDMDGTSGIEVVAEDDGPGIADLALAMRDGYSTIGGLGSGLPGTQRLMDDFAIWSERGRGTRVTAVIWNR
ncbi:anti-sigma regulatory factor [Rhodoplanes serenus]|uniref:Anti-sigma regulatory factor n=1 Tax=Rhodoplanes serenus TaxID=200615 RepID=A0A9X5AV15_9BRAD|nr:anti-sigma regulatory factor [Rhodoplanes serenus]